MREFGSFRVLAEDCLSCPSDLAQKDLLRFAAFDPGSTFPVTAVFSFDPGLALL